MEFKLKSNSYDCTLFLSKSQTITFCSLPEYTVLLLFDDKHVIASPVLLFIEQSTSAFEIE